MMTRQELLEYCQREYYYTDAMIDEIGENPRIAECMTLEYLNGVCYAYLNVIEKLKEN